jgi:hypothetical protein
MKTIFKYPIEVTDEQKVKLPSDSLIISAINQNGQLVIYALVDTEEKDTEEKTIRIFGTGHPCDVEEFDYNFLGSVVTGDFVWHIFAES